jgi:hypothetical protein
MMNVFLNHGGTEALRNAEEKLCAFVAPWQSFFSAFI